MPRTALYLNLRNSFKKENAEKIKTDEQNTISQVTDRAGKYH